MESPATRWAMLLTGAAIVFGVTVAIGLRLLPEPHSETDYLVVGSIATFLSLGVLFAVLIATWIKSPEIFFKRRKKESDDVPPPADSTPGA
ncbi:MAG: hypothetical protein J0H49_01760 [Acidobacteria bacterium]|nr:hypothetical protein [Acidobacteriota bacterium]